MQIYRILSAVFVFVVCSRATRNDEIPIVESHSVPRNSLRAPRTRRNEGRCERPLAPEHGFLHLLGELKVDSLALYSCEGGWKLVGASASKCLITGEWTSSPPKCIEESPTKRTTATAIVSTASPVVSTSPRSTATFVDRFQNATQNPPTTPKLTQEENCSCTYNSHDRKLLAIVKELPLWYGDKVKKGDRVTLTCFNKANNLVLPNDTSIPGSLILTCDVCRTWEDSDLPSCVVVPSGLCVLSAVSNGSVGSYQQVRTIWFRPKKIFVAFELGQIFEHNETVILRCKHGFVPAGSSQSLEDPKQLEEVVTCKDGQWSQLLECISAKSCGIPEQPENGQVTYSSLAFGSKLTFKCNRGYTLLDTERVICESDGTWSRTHVRCGLTGCLVPEKPPGSELKMVPEKDFFKFGETVTLSCPIGQSLNTDLERIMCLRNEWSSSTLPECE